MTAQVTQAVIADLDELAPLFDAYRQFYGASSDLQLARGFLLERFSLQQSIVFIARAASGEAVGFTQLYPSFTSLGCARIFVLNDLFVSPGHRGRGTARALLEAASAFAREAGALRLTLSTAVDNHAAQALYEKLGWRRDETFLTYDKPL